MSKRLRGGVAFVIEVGVWGDVPNPNCGPLTHVACASTTIDGRGLICPVCKAHDGLEQVKDLTAGEGEMEDRPYWHEAEVAAAV